MDKFYSHIYKNGISSIAKNNSSVSKNGKITQKNGVESLNNFFDLRNFVILNNSFLLKGLFAATLFCGVFVGELKAQTDKIPYVSINSNQTGPNTNHDSDGAKGTDSIAIGINVKATDVNSTAIGTNNTEASGRGAIAIGEAVKATKDNAVGIGYNVNSAGDNAIAIGNNANAIRGNVIAIGNNAGSKNFASTSIFIGFHAGYEAEYYDKETAELGWGSVMIGQDAGRKSKGDSNFYIGSSTGQNHTGSQNIFLGDTAKTVKYSEYGPKDSGVIVNEKTFGNRNIYIGNKYIHYKILNSDDYINDTIAIGTLANASKSKGIAIGSSSSGSKYGALSIGKNSIAIGTSTSNSKNGATAEGDNSISFGADTLATAIDGIALGSFSIANKKSLTKDDQKKVFLYEDENVKNTVKDTKGALSVGFNDKDKGFTRQITNVAAGSSDTDAVNVAQLRAGLDKGLKFAANSGVNDYTAKLGTTISVKGDDKNTDWNNFDSGKNIMTNIDDKGNIVVGLSKTLSGLESVTIENGPSMSQTGINAGGKKITNLANATEDTDAVAYGQVKNLINNAKTDVAGSIKFKVDYDKETKLKDNTTLTINGDGKNIKTTTDGNGQIKVSLNDKIKLGGGNNESKIELGKDGLRITQADGKTEGPSITTNGINAGNKVLTNLASGLEGKTLDKIKKEIDNAKGDPTKMPKEASNAATIGDLAEVNSKITNVNTDITNITNTTKNINNIIGGDPKGPNNLIDENGNLTTDGKEALATNAASGQGVIENTNIIQAINNINKQGTRFFHVNDGTGPINTQGTDGQDSSAGSSGGVAIGVQAKVGDNNNAKNAIAIGTSSQSLAQNAIAIGTGSNVNVEGGVALGSGSVANRAKNTKGYEPKSASKEQKEAIHATTKGTLGVVSVGKFNGAELKASRQITGVAAGTEDSDAVNVAQLKAVQQVAQGAQWIAANDKNIKIPTEAGGENSVAIGPGSNTKVIVNGKEIERTNTVSVGSKDIQRTISNVAPGVYDSDAATMGQLRAGLNEIQGKFNKYKKQASAGTASAMAMGNMPQSTIPGKGMMSLGSGFYDGQSAMAIGLSKMSDDGKWVFKGSASYDSQEKAGAALSIGFHF